MKSTNMRRLAAVATIAIAVPIAAGGTANAGGWDHRADGSFRFDTNEEDYDEARVSFDVAGDDDDGTGWWTYRADGEIAKGRILCVGGSDLNSRRQGESAAISIQIRSSSFDSGPFRKGRYVQHVVQDHPGPDRHRLATSGNEFECPRDDFRQGVGMQTIERGDIDVDVDND
ncbi:MAG: hypothetical protein ACT4QF_13405 [Sporichthyaceae bacterium]